VDFHELQQRLIDVARQRVRAGKFTERGLARVCGISQPHIHNILKNARSLSNESADRLLQALEINLPDLLWRDNTLAAVNFRAVPVMQNRIGPGSEAVFSAWSGQVPLPESLVASLVEPVIARLAPDLVLPRTLAANDLALLDQNPAVRSSPGGTAAWVVSERSGMRVRYLRIERGQLFAVNEATLDDPEQWQLIPLEGRNILEVVRARIVWIGREMEKEPAGSAEPARRSD
jgi:transcriptional regulator with XRE-family HTH domain